MTLSTLEYIKLKISACILTVYLVQVWIKFYSQFFLVAVEKLEQEIKELEEEIEKLKTQKPIMTVGDILNDTEKVIF